MCIMLHLYNTLTHKIEEFKPINPPYVGMYTCGPTVYDHMHIGNLRTFVFSDLIRRALIYNGYLVTAVQNITDIDDKIIKRAKERNTTIADIAKTYTELFLADIEKLHIVKSTHQPKATEYIDKMVAYIQYLLAKGIAYKEKDGAVYFDISKFPHYGKLSGIEKSNLKTGTRILSDEYTKEDVQDFALWKAEPEGATGSYQSALGWGRPGWHIECSVMSQTLLGDTFDIHAGGIDLMFPHHENEIAQSEAKTGKTFVNYFVHGAHILVDGKKMSKSLGNFYTLSDLDKKGIDPLALRYLYLQTHYRQEMNFTFESLEASQKALSRLREEITGWDKPAVGCAEFEQQFMDAINDDLNMPKALAVVWELAKSDYPGSAKAASLFKFDQVLGLGLAESRKEEIPEEVLKLVKEREDLRKQKNYHMADQLRNKVRKMGYEIIDDDATMISTVRKI